MPAKKINILVTTNPLNHEGGVVNYYNIIFSNNTSSDLIFIHSKIGSSQTFFYAPLVKKMIYPFIYIFNYLTFILKLIYFKIDIVQVNPSLIPIPIIRDFIILLTTKLFKRKVIVFFRGWKENVIIAIINNKVYKYIFVKILLKADKIFVLASSFKNQLINLGIDEKKIFITTTVVDETKIIKNRFINNDPKIKFLFLGRISKLKGINEFTDAIIILFEKHQELQKKIEFNFIGHEDKKGYINYLKNKLHKYIESKNVIFWGRVEGNEKYMHYHQNDIFVFPSWSEGCPNSVLEALASGLFIISTNVGALQDIIKEHFNGCFVQKNNSFDIYKKLLYTISNIDSLRKKRFLIQQEALNQFSSKTILAFLEYHYKNLLV